MLSFIGDKKVDFFKPRKRKNLDLTPGDISVHRIAMAKIIYDDPNIKKWQRAKVLVACMNIFKNTFGR